MPVLVARNLTVKQRASDGSFWCRYQKLPLLSRWVFRSCFASSILFHGLHSLVVQLMWSQYSHLSLIASPTKLCMHRPSCAPLMHSICTSPKYSLSLSPSHPLPPKKKFLAITKQNPDSCCYPVWLVTVCLSDLRYRPFVRASRDETTEGENAVEEGVATM